MIGMIFKALTGGLLNNVINGISRYLNKKSEERATVAAIDAKVELARANHEARLELADHEIQVMRTQNSGDSWKDEYVTLLVSAPILVSILGVLTSIPYPDMGARLLFAASQIAEIMTGGTIDYAALWLIVVTVALGTKPFRRR